MVQASKTENDSALSDKERKLRLGVLGKGAAVCKIGVIKSRDPLSEASLSRAKQTSTQPLGSTLYSFIPYGVLPDPYASDLYLESPVQNQEQLHICGS